MRNEECTTLSYWLVPIQPTQLLTHPHISNVLKQSHTRDLYRCPGDQAETTLGSCLEKQCVQYFHRAGIQPVGPVRTARCILPSVCAVLGELQPRTRRINVCSIAREMLDIRKSKWIC